MEPRVTFPDLHIYSGVRNSVLVYRALRINFANIGKKKYPNGAILHFDASLGFVDQTGNQHAVLIGDAYPSVVAGYAVNESGAEWGFDATTGHVKAALESGEVTLVQVVTLPLMSTLTDATDYSLFGDLLFVRRDGTSGSFKVSDGTNSAVVGYDWTEGEVASVCVQADSSRMRVGINKTDIADYILNFDGTPLQCDGDYLYWRVE